MKRRDFFKASSVIGLSSTLSLSLSGCDNSSDGDEKVPAEKNLRINYQHETENNPQAHYNALTTDEQSYLDEHFPDITPSTANYNHTDDEVFVTHLGSSKLIEAPSEKFKINAGSGTDYSYETTTQHENYSIHMFYKKINENNLFVESEEDDVVSGNLPKYSLVGLSMVVPDGSENEEVITVEDSIRDTVKSLIFSAPAFQGLSREDIYYALSKFDDIFGGATDFLGNQIKLKTKLESAIRHLGGHQWFYFQTYKSDDVPTLRNTESIDDNGNIIHEIGDAIYTFPLRQSLDIHLRNDLATVIQYFSSDERLSEILLPTQTEQSNLQKRFKMWDKSYAAKAKTYDGVSYSINTKSLNSEGLGMTLNKVDSNGLHITISNAYNRHASISVVHLDEYGNTVVVPDYELSYYPGSEGDPNRKQSIYKLGVISPRFALLAIPFVDAERNFVIPLPEGTHSVRFFFGALSFNDGHRKHLYKGQSDNIFNLRDDVTHVLWDAEAFTIAFELALPSLLIAWGAYLNRGASFRNLILVLGAKFAFDIASPFFNNPDLRGREAFLPILANMGTHLLQAKNELGAVLIKTLAEDEAEDSMPLAGQILRAINVAIDAANLGETLYAVSTVNAINYVDVTLTHTLKLQLQSDPGDNDFPLNVDTVVVTLSYSDKEPDQPHHSFEWDTSNIISHATDGGPTHGTYDLEIEDQPAGGFVTATIQLKIGHWVAAQKTISVNNLEDDYQLIILKENLIPIGSDSVYQHYAKFDNKGGDNEWTVKPDDEFLPSPSVSDTNRNSNELFKITVNDPIGTIGYSYKSFSDENFYAKNISAVLETPNQGLKSTNRLNMVQLAYNLTASESTDGHIIFETKGDLTYVRTVDINSVTNDFNIDFSKNIGTFVSNKLTQFGYFPEKSIVAGLDTEKGVLHILQHLNDPIDDTNTSRYLNAQSMVKTRSIVTTSAINPKSQFLYTPQLMTMSPTGDVIILEETLAGEPRLRAFDTYGTVHLDYPGFDNESGIFSLKQETSSVSYLDINIESKGFIYILKHLGSDPENSDTYYLDIYDPTSVDPNLPIVSTDGVSAAKFKVDHWRRVYSLNYETNTDNEPTISVWIPPVPS